MSVWTITPPIVYAVLGEGGGGEEDWGGRGYWEELEGKSRPPAHLSVTGGSIQSSFTLLDPVHPSLPLPFHAFFAFVWRPSRRSAPERRLPILHDRLRQNTLLILSKSVTAPFFLFLILSIRALLPRRGPCLVGTGFKLADLSLHGHAHCAASQLDLSRKLHLHRVFPLG